MTPHGPFYCACYRVWDTLVTVAYFLTRRRPR